MNLFTKTFPVGMLQCNCSIIGDLSSKEAILIDPGDDAKLIIDELEKEKFKLKAILHTHAHFDHFMATTDVFDFCSKKNTENDSIKVSLHKEDSFLWDILDNQAMMFGIPAPKKVMSVNHWMNDEETISFGDYEIKIIHTPGHSPGSCSFYLEVNEQPLLFSGDTLFKGSIGRTDLWKGNTDQILTSIKNRILPLDGDTLIIPGHGPTSKVGLEKMENPFLS